MNSAALLVIGMIGWLLLVAYSTIREFIAGDALEALLSGLILSILAVDLWGVSAPDGMEYQSSHSLTLWLWWSAAIVPYVIVFYSSFRTHRRSKSDPGPPP
jgi:hypothetical protein